MTNIAYSNIKQSHIRTQLNDSKTSVGNTTPDVAPQIPIVDMHISARALPKLDVGSPSDPMCVMFIEQNGKFIEVARTEVIWDNPNPQWVKILKAYYVFETNQPLRFCIYDVDSEKADLSKHDFIGYVDTTVQHIVSNYNTEIVFNIKHQTRSNNGQLVIISEQAAQCSSVAEYNISVRNLKKMHTFSKNHPYFVLSKVSESGSKLPSYKSEVVAKASTCKFKTASVPIQALCNGNTDVPITITFFNFRSGKVDEEIGSYTASMKSMMENQGAEYELKDKKKKTVGYVKINSLQITSNPTFLDYLRSGLQLNMITAIDFTGSNGDPRQPNSLHYLNPSMPNQYESCIWAVGGVVCPYDTDQQFPVFGFGGSINGQTSHCFPLTFNPQNPNVGSLQDLVGCYRNSLNYVGLSGPTFFQHIIKNATQVAQASWAENRTYTILLIITDGIINDMRETIDAVVAASDAPLSIIIVGVGNANFDAMDELDADDHPLRSSYGKIQSRDIVQFVPFRQFNAGPALASAVLEEVPAQVHKFCKANGFVPRA